MNAVKLSSIACETIREYVIGAAAGKIAPPIIVPGSGTAIIISEQEYNQLQQALSICRDEGLI